MQDFWKRYIDEIKIIRTNDQTLYLHRRVPESLAKNDPKYIESFWTDESTGDVYWYNLETMECKQMFKTTR